MKIDYPCIEQYYHMKSNNRSTKQWYPLPTISQFPFPTSSPYYVYIERFFRSSIVVEVVDHSLWWLSLNAMVLVMLMMLYWIALIPGLEFDVDPIFRL